MDIRVANIIEDGRLAGPQIRIAEVAKRLKAYNINTTVIYPEYQSDLFQQKLNAYEIRNIRFPLHRITKDLTHLLSYLFFFPFEIFFLYRLFKKEKFDIVHCSGGCWQYKGVLAGRLAGRRTVWHLNDTGIPLLFKRIFQSAADFFSDGIITAGQKVRERYMNDLKNYHKPIVEIQAPVDTGLFDPRKVPYDHLMIQTKGIKIVTVGNINPNKGLDDYITAASILNKWHHHLQFYIVGPVYDSQKKYAEMLYRLKDDFKIKNLHFYGTSKDVRPILKTGEIYVCSSLSEASPLSIWEAMSMEKAIVSTDVGDVARFIKDGENGFIVPLKDPEALADKVRILIENPDLRVRFGQKARETAKAYLDIQIAVQKHVDAYERILNLKESE